MSAAAIPLNVMVSVQTNGPYLIAAAAQIAVALIQKSGVKEVDDPAYAAKIANTARQILERSLDLPVT